MRSFDIGTYGFVMPHTAERARRYACDLVPEEIVLLIYLPPCKNCEGSRGPTAADVPYTEIHRTVLICRDCGAVCGLTDTEWDVIYWGVRKSLEEHNSAMNAVNESVQRDIRRLAGETRTHGPHRGLWGRLFH